MHVLKTDHCNGMWVAPLVDHLIGLLCKLAVLADSQADERPLPPGEEHQPHKYIEDAIRTIKGKLNPLLQSNDP